MLPKILRVPWTAHVTNASILSQLDMEELQLLRTIKKRKLSYFGHVKRHHSLQKVMLEGQVEGRRGRGRPRRRWIDDLKEWTGMSVTELGRKADDHKGFRAAVWEATSRKHPPG